MKVKDIVEILKCQVLNEANMEEEVKTACGSDMMSDVLAYVKDQAVLVTGLNNPQVVRTADMMDMICIVFVRGKKPDGAILQLAVDRGIAVLATKAAHVRGVRPAVRKKGCAGGWRDGRDPPALYRARGRFHPCGGGQRRFEGTAEEAGDPCRRCA
mgnify:CR=1 FL=1